MTQKPELTLSLTTTRGDRFTFLLPAFIFGDTRSVKVMTDVIGECENSAGIARDVIRFASQTLEWEQAQRAAEEKEVDAWNSSLDERNQKIQRENERIDRWNVNRKKGEKKQKRLPKLRRKRVQTTVHATLWQGVIQRMEKLAGVEPVKLSQEEKRKQNFIKSWAKHIDGLPVKRAGLKKGKVIDISGKTLQCFADSYRVYAFKTITPAAEPESGENFPNVKKFFDLFGCRRSTGDTLITTKREAEKARALAMAGHKQGFDNPELVAKFTSEKGTEIYLNTQYLTESHKWLNADRLVWCVTDDQLQPIWTETMAGEEAILVPCKPRY